MAGAAAGGRGRPSPRPTPERREDSNRDLMMDQIVNAVRNSGEVRPLVAQLKAINCHHNYVARERHYNQNILVTRKGAVRAREGDMGIIPGSMGARSYIVRGKGNPESFMSCRHGAGRAMSRARSEESRVGKECRYQW